jgi:hypothetical protein
MNRRIAAMLALLLAPAAMGQAISTQPSDSAIGTLISQLSDPVFGVREQAEKTLEEMGPAVEPQLRDAERGNLPDETRARIDDIIGRFQEALALHASVTLHYQDAPLTKILNDFADQAGGRMGIDDPSVEKFAEGRTASVDLDNADFWPAMRAVCKASGLSTSVGPGGVVLSAIRGRMGMPLNIFNQYSVSSGGLLIFPMALQEMRRIDYSTGQSSSFMPLSIAIFAEPKLHIVSGMDFNWLKECVDDKGHSLIAAAPDRRFFPGFMFQRGMRQWSWNIQANLQEVPDIGSEIARLRGELSFSAQTRGAAMEIDDITNSQTPMTRDGLATISVISFTKMNMNYRLTARFNGVSPNSPEFSDLMNTAQLVDDQGRTAQRQNYLPPRPFAGGFDADVIFQPTDISPSKLQWERTLEQKRIVVPFEIDHLPLPRVK